MILTALCTLTGLIVGYKIGTHEVKMFIKLAMRIDPAMKSAIENHVEVSKRWIEENSSNNQGGNQ